MTNENEHIDKVKKLQELIMLKTFDYHGIYEFIPQRPPFLMLDKVVDLDVDNKKVICQKCISSNEWFLVGHFPNNPVMPGVLMVEGMAQAASIIGKAIAIDKEGILLFASIDDCQFLGIATAGDVLTIEAVITKTRGPLVIGECCVKKDDQIIAKCNLKAFRKELS